MLDGVGDGGEEVRQQSTQVAPHTAKHASGHGGCGGLEKGEIPSSALYNMVVQKQNWLRAIAFVLHSGLHSGVTMEEEGRASHWRRREGGGDESGIGASIGKKGMGMR